MKKHALDSLKISSFVTADHLTTDNLVGGNGARETKDILVCTTSFGHSFQNTVCECPRTSPIECL